MNPTKVFAVLAAIVLAIVAIFFLTRPDTASPPAEPRTPDFSLTDTEAVARFEELHKIFRRGSRQRDLSLVSELFTADSPLREVAARDVRQLRRDGVLDRSIFKTTSLEVTSNNAEEIVISQAVVIQPRFILEATGENIADQDSIRQHVSWTLRPEDGTWLVYDSKVVESKD